MRIRSISVTNMPPIREFVVDGLSDVVVIAGPNGAGKSRLLQCLADCFKSPSKPGKDGPLVHLKIEATSDAEKAAWGQACLDTSSAEGLQKFTQTCRVAQPVSKLKSSALMYEGDRGVIVHNTSQIQSGGSDPMQATASPGVGLDLLQTRWTDLMSRVLLAIANERNRFAVRAEKQKASGGTAIPLDFPDPLEKFKAAFNVLLAPKRLEGVNEAGSGLIYKEGASTFTIHNLSSGEREVLRVAFDVVLREPEDCVVFFDEPELHLHPELSSRLIRTLRAIGRGNQFILATHSADIISASLEHSVVLLRSSASTTGNQAAVVDLSEENDEALRILGQSLGVISLGKRLVLIEGNNGSLDRQVYKSILKEKCPDLVLVPCGGKATITSFHDVVSKVLNRSVWGVDFFMLCDGDALPTGDVTSELLASTGGRLCLLPRYHLENYFLDPQVLSLVFEDLVPEEDWLRDPAQIEAELRRIAASCTSYATALVTAAHFRQLAGAVSIMPKGVQDKSTPELCALFENQVQLERNRLEQLLDGKKVTEEVGRVASEIESKLEGSGDEWKRVVPGRQILKKFTEKTPLRFEALKLSYIKKADRATPSPFAEITRIFEGFSAYPRGDSY